MNLFNRNKPKTSLKANLPSDPVGDMSVTPSQEGGIFKTYIPGFLYKPPFGYPRSENIPLIRQTARNGYVFSIIKTICDTVANAPWDIRLKDGIETAQDDEKHKEIMNFFSNPNGNKESFGHILRALTKDILELDSGVLVKVFNAEGKFSQLFARDGGSFLKNPDIYGYMGNREDFLEPADSREMQSYNSEEQIHYYNLNYKDQAAYFQYGWTSASMPIPFGRREIVYMMQNPRTDSIYGLSPIALLSDILYTLIYGSLYNLDFYMNNNMPEGFMSIIGGDESQLTAMKERFEQQFRKKDENTGLMRRFAFRLPWTNHEVKFTPFQVEPKAMQIIEQQQWFTKLVWSCFGVTPDEMGFTENSNKAVGEVQSRIAKEKATKPILKLIEYHINQEIMPEFETTEFEFKFVDYNIDDEMKKYDLYAKQQQVGVMTPEMIAEKEGIDVEQLKSTKEDEEEEPFEKKAKKILSRFKVGDDVRVIIGSDSYKDKNGVVEKVVGDSVIVRFAVGIEVFNKKQLVHVSTGQSISKIKAKDPFNSTNLEAQIVSDIIESGKKVKRILKEI